MNNHKTLTERDICTKFITPALKNAGWDIEKQMFGEVLFTDGKIAVRDKLIEKGLRKKADYLKGSMKQSALQFEKLLQQF